MPSCTCPMENYVVGDSDGGMYCLKHDAQVLGISNA